MNVIRSILDHESTTVYARLDVKGSFRAVGIVSRAPGVFII